VIDTPDDHCDGEFDTAKNRIRVRDDCEPQGELRILGHEICHYFLFWGGLHQGLVASCKDEDAGKMLVEGVCDFFGAALIEVIRDNPDLVDEIRKVYADTVRKPQNDQ
jgi:hypothetical protein